MEQLLEMGFRPAIEAILRCLPDPTQRQTLLFSATMPSDVHKIASLALKHEYDYVDCVGAEESTHEHVPQQYVVCELAHQVNKRMLIAEAPWLSPAVPEYEVVCLTCTARFDVADARTLPSRT